MQLVVFNVFDSAFYSGKLHEDFNALSEDGSRPWFFHPKGWSDSMLAQRLPLQPYSESFPTAEEAAAEAKIWGDYQYGGETEVKVFNFPSC